VYALFSGMSKQSVNDDIYKLYHGNVIHVFDWDGKNVGVIELNKYINKLSFNNDSVFYGTNIKDEPCIYEFKVK
ncbi:MAG TPA: BF3164 family lipoprotein, partial [Edaphocola sp.]|nr:BF3164 family lipoprotein [Edaphocola sp.]